MLHVHAHWLDAVWFMAKLDAPVKVRVAMAMRTQVLAPGELAPNRHLYVLVRGSVMCTCTPAPCRPRTLPHAHEHSSRVRT